MEKRVHAWTLLTRLYHSYRTYVSIFDSYDEAEVLRGLFDEAVI